MNLSNLKPPAGQKKSKKRVGFGMGSGLGKYSGRGAKGARSISGYSIMRGFEGGQMPLHRRLPKRGFSNADFKTEYAIINVGRLDKLAGDAFTVESLMASGAVKKLEDGVKVLGTGELTRAIKVTAHHFSESAKQKIEAAGGTVEVIPAKEKFLRKKK
jgi:large subunit ribosomal protein L15